MSVLRFRKNRLKIAGKNSPINKYTMNIFDEIIFVKNPWGTKI